MDDQGADGIRRQLQRDREHAAARAELLTSAENKLSAAIVAARSVTHTPAPLPEVKQPRTKNSTPEERAKREAKAAAAAPPPATVTQLPHPRGSMLDQEFRAKLEKLDESGRQFINGYMQALLDQRGLGYDERRPTGKAGKLQKGDEATHRFDRSRLRRARIGSCKGARATQAL
jgi:hypothetical protein